MFGNRKQIGYVSGLRLYNSLGLTSQVSGVIEIASNEKKRSLKFAGLRIRYVKAYGRVNKDDVSLMQLLDAIKDIYNIPDASVLLCQVFTCIYLTSKLAKTIQRELISAVKETQVYPNFIENLKILVIRSITLFSS